MLRFCFVILGVIFFSWEIHASNGFSEIFDDTYRSSMAARRYGERTTLRDFNAPQENVSQHHLSITCYEPCGISYIFDLKTSQPTWNDLIFSINERFKKTDTFLENNGKLVEDYGALIPDKFWHSHTKKEEGHYIYFGFGDPSMLLSYDRLGNVSTYYDMLKEIEQNYKKN